MDQAVRSITDYDVTTLAEQFKQWGHNSTHAPALLRDFYGKNGTTDFESLKIGNGLIARIKSELVLRRARVLARNESSEGTVKLLLGFPQGGAVETVLMTTNIPERAAGCISSQIGCAMACDFCASTKRGLERNLEAGEIVEQFLFLRELAAQSKRKLHTLVFMGMGEPLQNYDNVIAAIKRIAGEHMGSFAWRQITVSTVGIVPGIYKLAEAALNVNLAVSLHAPDDETRAKIVPTNKRYGVDEIIAATRDFYRVTGRITNIEYCMLGGVNDSDWHARTLAKLLNGFRTHVNLIPYNSIGTGLSGAVYIQPTQGQLDSFLRILRDEGVVAHIRRTRGDDVNAACGQLRETASGI